MTGAVQHVSIWKVGVYLLDISKYSLLNRPGDVSLSAEDRPPIVKSSTRTVPPLALPEPPPAERVDFPPPPLDAHQDTIGTETAAETYQEEQEEPRGSWLGGEQALKFLLAGGIAGAGELNPPPRLAFK